MAKRDFYEVLGVQKNVDDNELKRAFRQLARQYHPDVNPDNKDAEEKFKEINEAYEVLSDSQKRQIYDQFGHAGLEGSAGGFGGAQDFSGFGDIFSMFFGGDMGGASTRRPQRGRDMRNDLNVTFKEAAFGVEKEIEVARYESCDTCEGTGAKPGTGKKTCSRCNGTGQERITQRTIMGQFQSIRTCPDCGGEGSIIETPCPDCRGTGRVRKSRNLQVKVPGGVDSDSRLRLSGEGEIGANGGPPGDLFVFISVSPHEIFERRGDDIYIEMPLTFKQAALGADIEVPTIDGAANLKVPEGVQSHTILRLKGHGMTKLGSNTSRGRGDLLVRVVVMTPTKLSAKQKELLSEFDDNNDNENYKSFAKGFKQKNLFERLFGKAK